MRPHIGSIERETKPGALYRILMDSVNREVCAGRLARAIRTDCLSSHISAVRQQLPDRWRLHCSQRGQKRYYSIVTPDGDANG